MTRKWTPARPRKEWIAIISARHTEGWTDKEISLQLGCSKNAVRAYRCRILGLPSNKFHPRQRPKIAATTLTMCARKGASSFGELFRRSRLAKASRYGWGRGLFPRPAQFLQTLWERGPMTRIDLVCATGMRTRAKARKCGHESHYLGMLQRLGLVIMINRGGRKIGGKGREPLYSIPLFVDRRSA